ncbi:MAG: hypothetical protein K0S93_2361 [Nitrososphaeraceae archaeon]|jgi:hypothetical protein|nr:hypothetical protein [Nitrososphaeraceae archaeon]
MFSIANLYNSASSNAVIPIRIHPIMMSIIFHHYKTLTEKLSTPFIGEIETSEDINFNEYNNNNYSTILKQELDKWKNFSFVLRKPNRELFQRMIQSSYKYSSSINAKGENYFTESLLMSLIFEQHKMLINAVNNNKLDCYL